MEGPVAQVARSGSRLEGWGQRRGPRKPLGCVARLTILTIHALACAAVAMQNLEAGKLMDEGSE